MCTDIHSPNPNKCPHLRKIGRSDDKVSSSCIQIYTYIFFIHELFLLVNYCLKSLNTNKIFVAKVRLSVCHHITDKEMVLRIYNILSD